MVLCVPDPYFEALFSTSIESDRVYCSADLYRAIQNSSLYLFGSGTDVALSSDICTVNGQPYTLTVLDTSSGITEISRDEDPANNVRIDQVLIFPESAGTHWEKEDFVSYQVYFYPTSSAEYPQAYEALYTELGNVSISIYDPAAQLLRSSQDILDTANLSAYISVILLLIGLIGTVGIFLITIYKRKKDMAVAVAVGAPLHRIFLELFLEIFLVCFVGIFLGALVATVVTPMVGAYVPFVALSYSYAWQSVLLVILSIIGFPLLITKIALSGIHKTNLIPLLRGGE